jgi:hypothetical protein
MLCLVHLCTEKSSAIVEVLEGIWQCSNLATGTGSVVSMALHIGSPDGQGGYSGLLLRQEQWEGVYRSICLPVQIELGRCHTLMRLLGHNNSTVDELKILAVGAQHLLVSSTISKETIRFEKEQ